MHVTTWNSFFLIMQLWLTFAAIPNETAEFYHISLQQVDWFSITYFIIGFAFGFVGIMVIDDVGLRFAVSYLAVSTYLYSPEDLQ